MANRRFSSQFSYSFERQHVNLMGQFAQSGSTGAFAAKVTQGLTITAATMGSAGNSISVAFTAGATAGAEVVSVSGLAISVQIQSTVSTITQVRTAMNASAACAALVGTAGTSGSAVAAASALPLLSGADTVFVQIGGQSAMTLSQIGTGIFKLSLADSYPSLIGLSILAQKASATDLMSQIQSSDVTSAQSIVFRMIAADTPTNLASGDILFISADLRNSTASVQ